MNSSESLKGYGNELKAHFDYWRDQATPGNIKKVRQEYEVAQDSLERYKREKPEAWEEYRNLWNKYIDAVDVHELMQLQESLLHHPANDIESKYIDAFTRYNNLLEVVKSPRDS